jgi:alpha-mannosidase II
MNRWITPIETCAFHCFRFVSSRAQILLDQYRKKSQLYRTNVLFVQLGDDFRYVTMDEAKKQYENYDKLFTYMNDNAAWNVDVRHTCYH